jgi:hypothetical protein
MPGTATQQRIMKPDTLIYGLAGAAVMSAAVRLVVAWRRGHRETAISDSTVRVTSQVIFRSALRLILPLGAAYAAISILPALLDMPEHNAFRFLAASIVFGGICTMIIHASPASKAKTRLSDRLLLSGEVFAGLALFVGATLFRHAPAGGLNVQWPVTGKWRVIAGGPLRLTNYHHDSPTTQNYAIDMVSADSANPTLGAAVIAPVDAIVSKAVTDCRDGQPCADEGNHVILQTADGIEVWLAHLKEDSVSVRQGDSVKAGTLIGQCGATGSAEQPHLHIHAQKDGYPVPLRFGIERKWLIRADNFSAGVAAGTVQK